MAELLLTCENVSKVYRRPSPRQGESHELRVLDGINLEIHRGEMASIVGQSGVGKSTFLHILGTLDTPTTGRVTYADTDVFNLKADQLARFRNDQIGFIFQFHHLLAEFSALENVMLPALIAGHSRVKAARLAEPLLTAVGLEARMTHKPGELSGGEQQRVAIARALVMNPAVVFADEPTGNLDSKTSDEIHELLVALNRRTGTAFVVVTHNVRLAWKLDRHLLLSDGIIRELEDNEEPDDFLPQKGERIP